MSWQPFLKNKISCIIFFDDLFILHGLFTEISSVLFFWWVHEQVPVVTCSVICLDRHLKFLLELASVTSKLIPWMVNRSQCSCLVLELLWNSPDAFRCPCFYHRSFFNLSHCSQSPLPEPLLLFSCLVWGSPSNLRATLPFTSFMFKLQFAWKLFCFKLMFLYGWCCRSKDKYITPFIYLQENAKSVFNLEQTSRK